jgi:hypothetical protein
MQLNLGRIEYLCKKLRHHSLLRRERLWVLLAGHVINEYSGMLKDVGTSPNYFRIVLVRIQIEYYIE